MDKVLLFDHIWARLPAVTLELSQPARKARQPASQPARQPASHPYAGEGSNSHFWNSNFPKRLSGPSGGLGVTTTISSQTTCRSQPGRRHPEVFNKIRHFKWSRPWALMGYSVGSHGLLCLEFRSSQTASRSQRAPRSRSEFVVFRTRVQSAAG